MNIDNFFWACSVWLVAFVLGIISWPVGRVFFGGLSDRGYSISRAFGLIVISYLLLVVATLRILPVSFNTLIALVILWIVLNGLVWRKMGLSLREIPIKEVFAVEVVFGLLFGFLLFVKAHQPEIHQIERFMDYGFIQALSNANYLPLFDIWMAGENLNYYYFGHLMAFDLITLSRVPFEAGFYLVEAFQFGLVGAITFVLGKNLVLLQVPKTGRWWPSVAGMVSVFGVLFAGNWHSAIWFVQQKVPFWYAEATRVIPGTITEMPLYSFLVAELHAHTWGLLTGVAVVAALYLLWSQRSERLSFRNKYLYLLSFLLGIAYMANSWDGLTLGLLTAVVLIFQYRKNFFKVLIAIGGVGLGALITSLPWLIFFRPPLSGIAFVSAQTALSHWLLFWGAWFVLAAVFLGHTFWGRKEVGHGHLFLALIVFLVCWFWVFLETFYFKDVLRDGTNFRANTVFKISLQLWLWMGIISGPVLIFFVAAKKSVWGKLVWLVLIIVFVASQAVYPVNAIYHAGLEGRKLTGVETGLDWWKSAYPDDYAAYLYLKTVRDGLPENDRVRNILEADGDSYTDSSMFSTFLGWPTVSGWAVHEWTWRGSYEEVGQRAGEVAQVYTSDDRSLTKRLLKKYALDYIIVGSAERRKYGDRLQEEKLVGLGRVVFSSGEVRVVQLRLDR